MEHSLQLDAYDRNMSYGSDSRSHSFIGRLVEPNRVLIRVVKDGFSSIGLNISDAAVGASEMLLFLLVLYCFVGFNVMNPSPAWLLSLPMILVYWLVFLIAVDFTFSNVPMLERTLNPEIKAETLIREIKEGEMTPEEARMRIISTSFSGENLNHLVLGLSKEGLFIPSLQEAIFGSQKMHFRNLEILFCGSNDINMEPSVVSGILRREQNSLKDVEIMCVYKKYPKNFEVLSTLLSTQPSAYRILKRCVEEIDIIEIIHRYLEKNRITRSIAYADTVRMICVCMGALFITFAVTGFLFFDLFLACLLMLVLSPVLAKLVMGYAKKRLSAGVRKLEDVMGD